MCIRGQMPRPNCQKSCIFRQDYTATAVRVYSKEIHTVLVGIGN